VDFDRKYFSADALGGDSSAELRERAFCRRGGGTRIVVLDHLPEGVLVPEVYDPALNPLYRDVLAHYGAVAKRCQRGSYCSTVRFQVVKRPFAS
jgi:hypothetical protein